jgi:hypothetical protein
MRCGSLCLISEQHSPNGSQSDVRSTLKYCNRSLAVALKAGSSLMSSITLKM